MRMRRVLSLAILLASVLAVTAPAMAGEGKDAPTVWVPGPDAPFAWFRFDGSYYQPQGRVYFLGGRPDTAASTDPSVYYFDVATSTYADTGVDMPFAVSNYHIVQLTDATGLGLFVVGGFKTDGTYSTDVQVYRPETNTSAVVAGDVWPGTTTSGTVGCVDFPGAAIASGNKAYLVGGFAGTGCATTSSSDQTWIYDPMAAAGSRFTAGPAVNQARGYIQTAIIDNFLYAFGGDETSTGTLVVTPIAERLDLTNPAATWDDAGVADMPAASSGIAGCDESRAFGFNTGSANELAGSMVVMGCGQWTAELADSFQYVAATNTWAAWDSLNTARRNHAAARVVYNGTLTLWVFGGRSGSDNGIASSEYRTVATSPTAVQLTSLDGRSEPGVPLWPLALAGVAVLALAGLRFARARA